MGRAAENHDPDREGTFGTKQRFVAKIFSKGFRQIEDGSGYCTDLHYFPVDPQSARGGRKALTQPDGMLALDRALFVPYLFVDKRIRRSSENLSIDYETDFIDLSTIVLLT